MLYCITIVLHGEHGTASCRYQSPNDREAYLYPSLHALPTGGVLLMGQEESYQALPLGPSPIHCRAVDRHALWIAYCSPRGNLWAWGSADGRWHEYIATGVYLFAQEQAPEATPTLADTPPAPLATEERATQDLAQWGVVQVDTDLPAFDLEQTPPQETVSEENKPEEPTTMEEAQEETVLAQPALAEDALAFLGEHPAYTPLEALMPASHWVQVEQEECPYYLGVLFDSDGAPTHLCYGVRGERTRPFAAQAEWLGENDAEGYWIVYNALE